MARAYQLMTFNCQSRKTFFPQFHQTLSFNTVSSIIILTSIKYLPKDTIAKERRCLAFLPLPLLGSSWVINIVSNTIIYKRNIKMFIKKIGIPTIHIYMLPTHVSNLFCPQKDLGTNVRINKTRI